jgi:N-acetylmuramoyl-L-alanine amidase
MRNLNATEIYLIVLISACLGWTFGLRRLPSEKEVQATLAPAPPLTEKPDAASQSLASVDNIQFWQSGRSALVVVDVTGTVSLKTGNSRSTHRFSIDITPANLNASLKRTLEVPSGPLREIRAEQYSESTVRIVLDGVPAKEVITEQRSEPSRIVLSVAEPAGYRRPMDAAAVPARVSQAIPVVARRDSGGDMTNSPDSLLSRDRSSDAVADNASWNRTSDRKRSRVVIDAGHGGHDAGSVGPTGFAEKDLVLDLSKRLKTLLELEPGIDVVLTRSEDTFLALENRTQIANRERADLFISLHANSSPKTTVQGAETFVLNLSTRSGDALTTASRENASYGRRIHDLPDILSTIASNDKTRESLDFANHVQTALSLRLNKGAAPGVLGAPLAVLIGARMPAVFVEVSYISNPAEEQRLRTAEYRQQIAESLFQGIKSYTEKTDGASASNLAGAR